MHILKIIFACFIVVSASASASAKDQQILIVVTNHSELGDTGKPTGYFLSEVAHPWHVFIKAGYKVDFASPAGGFAPMDPSSFDLEDSVNRMFWHTLAVVESVTNTLSLDAVDMEDYAAIFLSGGHGTMWDFAQTRIVAEQIARIYQQGGVVGAVCHGPAALLNVELNSGRHLLDGKRVTGFTNDEEAAVKLTEVMPFLLESEMQSKGATFVAAANFQPNVVVDQRLVTGQNPASATAAAEAIVQLLSE
jgi:putative intracellular protease/amidase